MRPPQTSPPRCGQAPPQRKHTENGGAEAKERGGAPLLSECALQEAADDLRLHLSLSVLFTLPVMLSAPSLLHWSRNLRYAHLIVSRWRQLTHRVVLNGTLV